MTKWLISEKRSSRAEAEDTKPEYPEELIIPETSLTMRWIRNYRKSIIVAEDAMRFDERSRQLQS